MVWEGWLASIAPSLNVTATQAGVILSFVFIFAAVLMIAMAAPRYAAMGVSITAFIGALFFTYIAWLPVWTGTAISFVLAIFAAMAIRNGLK